MAARTPSITQNVPFLAVHAHTDSAGPEHGVPDVTSTSRGYYTHSARQPLGVCSLLWMVVIIFGHLARERVTMETSKQWSSRDCEGGALAGRAGGCPLWDRHPSPSLGQACTSRPRRLAASLGSLVSLCLPCRLGVSPTCGLCVSPSLSVSGQPLLAVWVLAKLILGSL